MGFKVNYTVLKNLMDDFEGPAHIKYVRSNRYLYANNQQLDVLGFTSLKSLKGLTEEQLFDISSMRWELSQRALLHELEKKALKSGYAKHKDMMFIDAHGKLRRHTIFKVWLEHFFQGMNLLLTFDLESHQHMSLMHIFDGYLHLLNNNRQACRHMLEHLNVQTLFYQNLSVGEIRCLLYLQENKPHKVIARLMKISVKTVQSYIASIVEKSNCSHLRQIITAIQT